MIFLLFLISEIVPITITSQIQKEKLIEKKNPYPKNMKTTCNIFRRCLNNPTLDADPRNLFLLFIGESPEVSTNKA